MDSIRSLRNKKLGDQIARLQTAISLLGKYTTELLGECVLEVNRLINLKDVESYLTEYTPVYSHLTERITLLMDINCKFEVLLRMNEKSNEGKNNLEIGKYCSEKNNGGCEPFRLRNGERNKESEPQSCPEQTSSESGNCGSVVRNVSIEEIENSPVLTLLDLEGLMDDAISSETKEIPLRPLNFTRKAGVMYDVIVTHLVSPEEFYVHVKCDDFSTMDEMNRQIGIYVRKYEGKPMVYHDSALECAVRKMKAKELLGNFGLGNAGKTKGWLRVEITDWLMKEEDDIVQVFYVDHGSISMLSLKQLIPLSASLRKYPQFTQKCYLSSLLPVETEGWSEEDRIVFEIFTESAETKSSLRIEVTEFDPRREDGAVGVKAFIPDSDVCINDKLVEFGNARRQLSEDEAKYLPAFAVNDSIPVKITHVTSITHVYCVRDYEKLKENDVLRKLLTHLNSQRVVSDLKMLSPPPEPGSFVLGKYDDGLWYRAKVISADPDKNVYELLFIDYGNTEKVGIKDMRMMETKFLKIPFQTLECYLDGIQPSKDDNVQEGFNYYRKLNYSDITIHIKAVLNGNRSMYRVGMTGGDGKDVATHLVAAGHAVWAKGTTKAVK